MSLPSVPQEARPSQRSSELRWEVGFAYQVVVDALRADWKWKLLFPEQGHLISVGRNKRSAEAGVEVMDPGIKKPQ